MRRVLAACCGLMLWIGAVPARAEDSDALRGYFQLKLGDSAVTGSGVHDYYGFGVGLNLNRYVGVELSGDHFEIFPKVSGREIGEYGVFAIMPQVRLRVPVLGDRLVPYAIAGAGIAMTDFNDRKSPAFGLEVKDQSTTPVGTVGAGIEYFLADNIAVGLEFKYLFAGDQTLKVGGASHRVNASTPLASFSVRMFYPELHPTPVEAAPEPAPLRLYGGFRLGFVVPTDTDIGPGVEARPLPYAIGGKLNEHYGVGIGLDIGRYFGVEVSVEGYEVVMALKNVGSVGEYAFYSVVPQARVRYPLLDGRLVPYLIGGVGYGFVEFNDRKPRGANLSITHKGSSGSYAATLGAGVEYFVTRRVAAGIESKYSYSPGHPLQINHGPEQDGTLQGVVVTAGLRVYLFEFGR